MNTQSALEMKVGVLSQPEAGPAVTPFQKFADWAARSRKEKFINSSQASSAPTSNYCIGEKVYHGGFGDGQVLAHWPDGRLLVRFENARKNQLIFPTYLRNPTG